MDSFNVFDAVTYQKTIEVAGHQILNITSTKNMIRLVETKSYI